MRNWFLGLGSFLLVSSGSASAENDKVLTGPPPDWAHPSDPLPVPEDAGGVLFVRKQDTVVRLTKDGQVSYENRMVRVLNSQALQVGNLSIVWNPAVGAPTIHSVQIIRDGMPIDVMEKASFEVLRREDQLEIAMLDGLLTAILKVPDLRVGDDLEFSYSVPSQDPTMGGDSYGILYLANSTPDGRFRLSLNWDDSEKPNIKLTPDFEKIAERGSNSIDLRIDNPEIVNPPNDAPPRFSWMRVFEYSDFDQWRDLSKRMAPLYVKASGLREESPLLEEAARIASAHSGELERAQAALNLVQRQVRYIYVGLNGGNLTPAAADETWERRYGDCKGKTVLLLALLAQMGIKAEPVLVSNAGADDGLDERLPSPGMFDHVLVQATIDGQKYWLDGTLPDVARASTTPIMPYRWVLPLRKNGAELVALPQERLKLPSEAVLFEIDARAGFDQPARIVQTMIQRGIEGLADYVRYSSISSQQLENALRNSYIGGGMWTQVDEVKYHYDLDTMASILTVSGMGTIDWDEDGAEGRSLYLPGGGFNPPDRRQRGLDQEQSAPYYNKPDFDCRVTTVRLPEDTDPKDWYYNSWFDRMMFGKAYYRAFERRDRTIRMVRGFRTEETEISPELAARDNARVPDFDNSMARIHYRPGDKDQIDWKQSRVPATYEVDWSKPGAPCLPPDLLDD